MHIRQILHISRPRFWIYEFATFAIIGTLSASQGFLFLSDWRYWIFCIYFLLPANILIYGINDIFDYETDKFNPKKGDNAYESLVTPEKRSYVWKWIIATNIPFLFFLPPLTYAIIAFVGFIFFASLYSATPIRAKAKPFIDSIFSAGHYVATGIFGYYLAGGVDFPMIGIVSGMLWCIAMHAYSAIPDIQADMRANLKTIAVMFGKKNTIYICSVLYLMSAFFAKESIPIASVIGSIILSYIMYVSIKTRTEEKLFRVYTHFPTINTVIGALISIELLLKNL